MIGFQAAYARRGIKLELGERLALGFQFHLAKSREDGMLLQRLGQDSGGTELFSPTVGGTWLVDRPVF